MVTLEQRQHGGWVEVTPHTGRLIAPCPAVLDLLRPGGEVRGENRLPAALAPGAYRFRTRIESPAFSHPQTTIFSETFQVRHDH